MAGRMHQVDHYGLHQVGGVVWLVQGRGGTNFAGLKERCPLRVKGGMCNHLIPAAAPVPDRVHWEQWLQIFPDPLVKVMVPLPRVPGTNLFYVEDEFDDLRLYFATLSRLSSPIYGIVKSAEKMTMKDLESELAATNIQPMVVVQANQDSKDLIEAIAAAGQDAPRTVVVTGAPDVETRPPFQQIRTQIRNTPLEDLMMLPLENIGAATIRRYARREQLDAPMETRQARRERQIRERKTP